MKLDFLGVGPQKTGTTWLYEVLKNNPGVCMPTITKEIQFFDRFYDKGLKEYNTYFDKCTPELVTGEITPGYFDTFETPGRVHKHFPNVKIIISLRHPIYRTESLFRHYLRKGMVSEDFKKAIVELPQIVDSGRYKEHIERWLSFFKKDQIKIILMEDIEAKPKETLLEILDFLSVDTKYIPETLEERVNVTGMAKYPVLAKYAAKAVVFFKDNNMHSVVNFGKALGLKKVYEGGDLVSIDRSEKKKLLDIYKQDTMYVEKLLNRKLSNWYLPE